MFHVEHLLLSDTETTEDRIEYIIGGGLAADIPESIQGRPEVHGEKLKGKTLFQRATELI